MESKLCSKNPCDNELKKHAYFVGDEFKSNDGPFCRSCAIFEANFRGFEVGVQIVSLEFGEALEEWIEIDKMEEV